ncbi:MAG: hypothetical protein QME66_09575 [Candidatus Eisenbacteria bacterium]|nr:hypothetical protein [Candidatus Eisenbacteria bacterium]
MFDISAAEFARGLGAFVLLFLFPGWLLLRLLLRKVSAWHEVLPAAFAGSLFLYLPTILLGKSGGSGLLLSGIFLAAVSLVLLFLNIFSRPRRAGSETSFPSSANFFNAESIFLAVFLLIIIFSMLREKGTFGVTHDSLDHVSAVREIVETGAVFPRTTFYAQGDGEGLDPRKGIFQPALALVSVVSGVNPVRMWIFLPILLAPLLVLSFYSFSKEMLGGKLISALCLVLFFFCFAGSGVKWLRMSAYGNRVAEGAVWIALAYLIRYVREGNARTLAFSVLSSLAAVSVHIFSVLYLGIAGGGYLIFLLFYRGSDRQEAVRRILHCVGLFVLTILPLAIFRVAGFGPALNPIHTHEQGLLYFTRNFYIINPFAAPEGSVWTTLVSILLVPIVFRMAMRTSSRVFILSSTVVPVLFALNPLVVPVLAPRIGYLVQRFIYVIPYLQIMSLFVWEALPLIRLPGRILFKAYSVFVFLVLLFFLNGSVSSTISSYSGSILASEEKETPVPWVGALRFLDTSIPEPSVVLSDPVTSYSITGLTKHRTVAVLHQHSSPGDALAVERLDDVNDVLSPFVPMGETLGLLEKYGVKFVLLNQTFDKPVFVYRGIIDPRFYERQGGKFDRFPQFFRKLISEKGVVIYEVKGTDTRQAVPGEPEAVPLVLEVLPGNVSRPEEPVLNYGISYLGASFPDKAGRGAAFEMNCYWERVSNVQTDLPLYVFVRFDTEFRKGALYRQSYGKLYRKLLERKLGRLFRFREDHIPVSGMFPPKRWPLGKIVVDNFSVNVPKTLAPGLYDMKVKLSAEPVLPNLPLKDLFVEEDYFSGAKTGVILIE